MIETEPERMRLRNYPIVAQPLYRSEVSFYDKKQANMEAN